MVSESPKCIRPVTHLGQVPGPQQMAMVSEESQERSRLALQDLAGCVRFVIQARILLRTRKLRQQTR